MPSIHLNRISFAYSDSLPILSDVSLQLVPGWYGVVGPNGAGKTTLLRLLGGDLAPADGDIRFHPPGTRPRLCPQRVESVSEEIEVLAASTEGAAHRVRGQLELEPADLARWPTLSAGQQKRWQIGAALAMSPPVLLLDEPTNHLDVEARNLLLDALVRFRGIGLVVSHDRALLNRLTSTTLRFDRAQVSLFRGGYDRARGSWEALERERRDEAERLRGEQKKLERRLRDRQQRKAQSMAALRTSKHMYGKSPKDNAARNAFKGTRRRSKDISLGKEVRKTHHLLARVSEKVASYRFQRSIGRSIFVDYVPSPARELLTLDLSELRAGPRVLLRDVCVSITRESRIRIAGPNGVGKTTLLRALLDASRLPPSRILHLPQELCPAEEIALLDSVRALDPFARGDVLGLVAALGVEPDPLLASRRPSPGEARKLAMAYGLATEVWGLVLDEPTNHLDLPSIERLEEMLAEYPGALLLVTHDDELARRCTSIRWDLAGRRIVVRPGDLGGEGNA